MVFFLNISSSIQQIYRTYYVDFQKIFQKKQSFGVLQNKCFQKLLQNSQESIYAHRSFQKNCRPFSLKFQIKDKGKNISKNFKNTFLQDTSRRLLLIFRKLDIQTFNSKQICSLDQYCWQAIYLISRNVSFRISILESSYYKNNFLPEKFNLDNSQYANLLVQITFQMAFIKHSSQVRHVLIPYLFHVFQDSCISGFTFFRIQVFQGLSQGPGPGVSSSLFCQAFWLGRKPILISKF